MIDAMDYITQVEEALDPPRPLSREDMVILALVDNRRVYGECAACGAPTNPAAPNARWCKKCGAVARYFMTLRGMSRNRRPDSLMEKVCECGAPVTAGNSAYRCDECQRKARLAGRRESWRKRRMSEEAA